MKKKWLICLLSLLIVILLISSFFIFKSFNSDNKTKKEPEKVKENIKTDILEEEPVENQEDVESSSEDVSSPDPIIKDESTNQNNKPNNNQSLNNNHSGSQTTPPVPPSENNIPPKVVETPKCTPKKFDMNWVRADFNSFSECTTMGDKYKAIGYGYYCDHYQDDCLDTYYMLTLYKPNSSELYDYHTIPLN